VTYAGYKKVDVIVGRLVLCGNGGSWCVGTICGL